MGLSTRVWLKVFQGNYDQGLDISKVSKFNEFEPYICWELLVQSLKLLISYEKNVELNKGW